MVEKVKEIKSKEKELIKAKEELFDPENVNDNQEKNIEIKLKIENPEGKPLEPKESVSAPNSTISMLNENGTNIEINLKIAKENDKKKNLMLEDEPTVLKVLNKQENIPNSSKGGIFEKIHEIKQRQKEIKVAKESIINELDEKKSSVITEETQKALDKEGHSSERDEHVTLVQIDPHEHLAHAHIIIFYCMDSFWIKKLLSICDPTTSWSSNLFHFFIWLYKS